MRLALLLFVISAGLSSAQEDKLTLSGKVTDSVTHFGIANASVRVRSQSIDKTALSGPDGSYSFDGLTEGTVMVFISRDGYAPLRFPLRGAIVDVRRGSSSQSFELRPAAQISGKIVDEESGQPIGGMRVQVYRIDYTQAIRRLVIGGSDNTKADGAFHISNLPSASYVLEAMPGEIDMTGSRTVKAVQAGTYRRQYYPQASTSDSAVAIPLATGESRSIDFLLARRKPLSISGVIEILDSERRGETLSVLLSEEQTSLTSGIVMGQLSSGPFHIDNLGPGTYRLSGQTAAGKPKLFGDTQITLTDRDVEGIRLTVQKGFQLSGVIHMKGDDGKFPGGVEVAMQSLIRQGPPFAEFSDEGQFVINDVPLGDYFVGLSHPAGYSTTAMTWKGRSMLGGALSVDGAPGSRLEITLEKGSALGSVSGIVRQQDGQPATSVHLALVPDPMPWPYNVEAGVRTYEPLDAGRFAFDAVAPGNYRLVQFSGDERRSSRDPALIAHKASAGERVTVTAGSQTRVDLTVK